MGGRNCIAAPKGMSVYSIAEAKDHLSKLIDEALRSLAIKLLRDEAPMDSPTIVARPAPP
jgi:hypothetical protein